MISVKGGYSFSAAVCEDGSVWTWGSNIHSTLGYEKDSRVPKEVPNLIEIVAISTGSAFVLALNRTGEIWGWGNNSSGQLGLDDTNKRELPTKNPYLTNIVQISSGTDHTIALDSEGSIWSFGNNDWGELGIGHCENTLTPQRVPKIGKAQHIATGIWHSVVLDENSRLWGFGCNKSGQLGSRRQLIIIPNSFFAFPKKFKYKRVETAWCTRHGTIVREVSGVVWVFGDSGPELGVEGGVISATRNRFLETMHRIYPGPCCIYAVDAEGNVYSCGYNDHGQLGKIFHFKSPD